VCGGQSHQLFVSASSPGSAQAVPPDLPHVHRKTFVYFSICLTLGKLFTIYLHQHLAWVCGGLGLFCGVFPLFASGVRLGELSLSFLLHPAITSIAAIVQTIKAVGVLHFINDKTIPFLL